MQLLKDLRPHIPGTPGRPARIDYEYERKGVVSAFLFTNPLEAWRRVSMRQRRTAIDWAQEVKFLLDEVHPGAARVTLVCDNLNTHRLTSLYKAFPAEVTLRLDLTVRDRLHTEAWKIVMIIRRIKTSAKLSALVGHLQLRRM